METNHARYMRAASMLLRSGCENKTVNDMQAIAAVGMQPGKNFFKATQKEHAIASKKAKEEASGQKDESLVKAISDNRRSDEPQLAPE